MRLCITHNIHYFVDRGMKQPHASQFKSTHNIFALIRGCKSRELFKKKSNWKWKSLFVNEDKSNASILHAITISLTTTIWKILPEKRDHLTPHLWPNPAFPLGALRNHNVYLCSSWTQMLKKARGITKSSQTRSHTAPVIEKIHYSD